jgi:hypothetical protein
MVTLPKIPKIDTIFVFLNGRAAFLISNLDSTLNFEFTRSFCQHLSVMVFDLSHLSRKKAPLQGFIKKSISPEPLEINN